MKIFLNKKGFTLIELLVVVLIISILAAIAVPQYQMAVLKSRAGQVMSLVRSVASAQDAYYLANGEYADSFEKLDLTLPSSESCDYDNFTCRVFGDWHIKMYCPNGACASVSAAFYDSSQNAIFAIVHYLMNKRSGNAIREKTGNLACVADSGEQKAKGQKICKALGGTLIENSGELYYRL